MENRSGKFPSHRLMKLMLRRRFVWSLHFDADSVVETALFAHQLHTDVQMGRFPVGDNLLIELIAIMCQVSCQIVDCVHFASMNFFIFNRYALLN